MRIFLLKYAQLLVPLVLGFIVGVSICLWLPNRLIGLPLACVAAALIASHVHGLLSFELIRPTVRCYLIDSFIAAYTGLTIACLACLGFFAVGAYLLTVDIDDYGHLTYAPWLLAVWVAVWIYYETQGVQVPRYLYRNARRIVARSTALGVGLGYLTQEFFNPFWWIIPAVIFVIIDARVVAPYAARLPTS